MICGPLVQWSNTCRASSAHWPMVPSMKRPLEAPWP